MKKHDHCTAFGLICGVMVIVSSAILGKKDILESLVLFYDVPSIFIVMCGSFGAIVVSFEWETIKSVPSVLKNAFLIKPVAKKELIKVFVEFSKQVRRAGILSLEDSLGTIHDQYLKSGMQMVIDATDEETIRMEMVLEGIIAVRSGISPRVMEDNLKAFLSPKETKVLRYYTDTQKLTPRKVSGSGIWRVPTDCR